MQTGEEIGEQEVHIHHTSRSRKSDRSAFKCFLGGRGGCRVWHVPISSCRWEFRPEQMHRTSLNVHKKKDPKQCCKSFIACKNLLRDWVFWRAELKRKSMQRSSGSSVFSAKGCNLFWKTKINMTRILDSVKATDFWQIYFSLAVRLRPEPSDFYLLLLKTLPAGKMCVCPPQTTAKFVQNHKSQ